MASGETATASQKSFLRVPEIARDLDVSVELVYQWVRQGRIQGTRLGKQTVRIHREEYQRFLQDLDEISW